MLQNYSSGLRGGSARSGPKNLKKSKKPRNFQKSSRSLWGPLGGNREPSRAPKSLKICISKLPKIKFSKILSNCLRITFALISKG